MIYTFSMKRKPLVIGHRGAARLRPENTMESFRFAFDSVDEIEFDVWLSKDGVPFILHDDTLDRTTDGSGIAIEKTFAELRRYDAGYHFDPNADKAFPFRGRGLFIPSFEELLDAFPQKKFSVEIKHESAELTRLVVQMLAQRGLEGRSIVGSEHHLVYRTMKTEFPHIPRFLSRREIVTRYIAFRCGLPPRKNPGDVASMPVKKRCWGHMTFYDKDFIDWLHRGETLAYFWTVNLDNEMRMLEANGADGIISDDPALVIKTLGTGPKGA